MSIERTLLLEARRLMIEVGESMDVPIQFDQHRWLLEIREYLKRKDDMDETEMPIISITADKRPGFTCQCFHECEINMVCVCQPTEHAIRVIANGLARMTQESRELCLSKIDSVEGYSRRDFETSSDADVAKGVLSAWVDYCRDKGMI